MPRSGTYLTALNIYSKMFKGGPPWAAFPQSHRDR
jgi:hypothetical protein